MRRAFTTRLLIGASCFLWAGVATAETQSFASTKAMLRYSEATSAPAPPLPPTEVCAGEGMTGKVNCIMNDPGEVSAVPDATAGETISATLAVTITPILSSSNSGGPYQMALQVDGNGVQFVGEFDGQAWTQIDADAGRVQSALSGWKYDLTSDQLLKINSGETLRLPLSGPFTGLSKLALDAPVELIIQGPVKGWVDIVPPLVEWFGKSGA